MQLNNSLVGLATITTLLVTLTLGIPTFVSAQDDDIFMLEEVTVTAEKRTSELQKTPLPIDAIDGESLVRQNVRQMTDVAKILPDVEIDFMAAAYNVITIRGVTSSEWGPISDMPNQVMLDGAVLSRTNGMNNHFYDIERLEVLKGPQGTLYGRGAAAGVINIITRKPSAAVFSGNAEVEYGNYDLMRAEGAINMPISDTLAIRAAYRSLKQDGYFKDTNMGNTDAHSMRLSMLWEPTERLSLLATADKEEFFQKSPYFYGFQYLGTFGDLVGPPADKPWRNLQYFADNLDSTFETQDMQGWMTELNYSFDFATMTVQYNKRKLDQYQNINFELYNFQLTGPNTGIFMNMVPIFPIDYWADWESFEARLTSNTEPGDRLEWVAGVYYFGESIYEKISGAFLNRVMDTADTDSKAVFGQATWTPSQFNRLHLTGGLRYDTYEKSMLSDETPPITSPPEGPTTTHDYDYTTYKLNLSYDINDDSMVYAQVASGFKSGYISSSRQVAPEEELMAYEIGSKNRFLDNRLQINFEAYYYDYTNYQSFAQAFFCYEDADGDKLCEDANGDGVVNNDDQYILSTTISPGDAEQYGASISAQYLLTRNDVFSANLTYQHNEYRTYNIAAATLAQYPDAINLDVVKDDQSGRQFGPAPWNGNVSYTHTFHLRGTDLLELTGDLYYHGQGIDVDFRKNTPEEYSLPGRDAYWLGDISARYTSSFGMPAGAAWYVRLWVNNLFDSDDIANLPSLNYYDKEFFSQQYYGERGGYMVGNYVQPRTVGIVFGATW